MVIETYVKEKGTDEELALEYQRGNLKAFEELHRRYEGKLCALASRTLRSDPSSAEDIVQETWLRVIRKIDGYDPREGKFNPWISTIARNVMRSHLEGNFRREDMARLHYSFFVQVDTSPEKPQVTREELIDISNQGFERDVVKRVLDGYTLSEISRATGNTLRRVRYHYKKYSQRVKKNLLLAN